MTETTKDACALSLIRAEADGYKDALRIMASDYQRGYRDGVLGAASIAKPLDVATNGAWARMRARLHADILGLIAERSGS